jgi:hypothetical protein
MNAHAVCEDVAEKSVPADMARDRADHLGHRRQAGLFCPGLALVMLVVLGPWPAAAQAAPASDEYGHVVDSMGVGGPPETFDSVLLQAPGSRQTAAAVTGDSNDEAGLVATDDAREWLGGNFAADGDRVTFSAGLQMLCPRPCRDGCDPLWSVQVDALMLWRTNMESVPLFLNSAGGVALDANQMQPPMAAGPRVSVLRKIEPCVAIEGSYFNVSPFAGQKVLPETGGPFSMTNFGDLIFDDVEQGRLNSSARIQSAELNWRQAVGPVITCLAGFRWVQWNEQMAATYQFANANPANLGSGSTTASTGNDLYGGQFGVDAMLWDRGGPWKVTGLAKAGVYYNRAYQNSTAGFVPLPGFGPPYELPSVSASKDQIAFVGEAGLNSTYWLKSWLAWRVGYSLFWLNGVAVAPQQFALASYGAGTTTINTNGSVFLHGLTTGLEARW